MNEWEWDVGWDSELRQEVVIIDTGDVCIQLLKSDIKEMLEALDDNS